MICWTGSKCAYVYLMNDDSEKKKAKGTKKCVIKRILKFNDYEDCNV